MAGVGWCPTAFSRKGGNSMSHRCLAKFGLVVLALALCGLVATQWVSAAPPQKGSMSGRVLHADGKPASGIMLRVEKFDPRGAGGGGGGGGSGERGEFAPPDSGARGLNMMGSKVIAQTTTDQNGDFNFKTIEAGGFMLIGGNKKLGWVYQSVTVEPNKETKLGEITLTKTD